MKGSMQKEKFCDHVMPETKAQSCKCAEKCRISQVGEVPDCLATFSGRVRSRSLLTSRKITINLNSVKILAKTD